MKYKFRVTQTDTYIKEFNEEADNINKAYNYVLQRIEQVPIDMVPNTFDNTDINVESIPIVHNVEGLFSDDPNDSPDVILIDDLSEEQKTYLGITN